jgi:hypothetical protein
MLQRPFWDKGHGHGAVPMSFVDGILAFIALWQRSGLVPVHAPCGFACEAKTA